MRIATSPLNTFLRGSPARLVFRKVVKPIYVRLRESAIGLIEWRYGIRTGERIMLSSLGLDTDKDRQDHIPSGWLTLPRILQKREVRPEDVLVDFGSGMGRVVFQAAARYPFRRVVGVEISAQLHAVAQANIARNLHRLRCKEVQLVNRDVLDYEIPHDVSVAYFGNPFTGDTFKAVIHRLLASVDHRPRRLRVIYFNPVEHEFLLATGRLRMIRRLRGFRPTAEWSRSNSTYMYEVIPQSP